MKIADNPEKITCNFFLWDSKPLGQSGPGYHVHDIILRLPVKLKLIKIFLGLSVFGLENRFECPRNCGRSFEGGKKLTVHLKLECGVAKKFHFQYCDKHFTRNRYLKRHVSRVHGISLY